MERDADAVAAARRLALIRAATLEAAHLSGRCNEALVGEESRITSQAVRHTPIASQSPGLAQRSDLAGVSGVAVSLGLWLFAL